MIDFHTGCGAREFMKLHALGLQEYDAVLVVDNDFAPAGPWSDFGPLFDCAAEGRLLTTRASYSAVNGALVAAPPSAALLAELLGALATATVGDDGWGDAHSWGPFRKARSRVTQARVQGFLYWYYHQQRGVKTTIEARQVDACVWNLQRGIAKRLCRDDICANRTVGFSHAGLESFFKSCR